jgi:hypothetical protein
VGAVVADERLRVAVAASPAVVLRVPGASPPVGAGVFREAAKEISALTRRALEPAPRHPGARRHRAASKPPTENQGQRQQTASTNQSGRQSYSNQNQQYRQNTVNNYGGGAYYGGGYPAAAAAPPPQTTAVATLPLCGKPDPGEWRHLLPMRFVLVHPELRERKRRLCRDQPAGLTTPTKRRPNCSF